MITNEKHLLHILGVDKGQLEYLLTHLEDYYPKIRKQSQWQSQLQ